MRRAVVADQRVAAPRPVVADIPEGAGWTTTRVSRYSASCWPVPQCVGKMHGGQNDMVRADGLSAA